jgi:alkanesulfonate monooxygenase SsuD/methylene tetrahydromethanopterin reductase-like flavin-dependent oxidoreductase (luciferase family)
MEGEEQKTTMSRRGFGVAAAIPGNIIGPLARAAEDAGYSTFWVNDTPGGDGIKALEQAAGVTPTIRLGVGVIPLDRRPPEAIAESVANAKLPIDRLIIGIGAGGRHAGSLEMVEQGIAEVRDRTGAAVAVGALGMNMIGLAGRLADAVILNWLTPEWAKRSADSIRDAGSDGAAEVIGYVRTALEAGRPRLESEANRYASVPAYARHFDRMGVAAIDTCVIGTNDAINSGLSAFDPVLDETVVRAIVLEESLESYLEVLNAGRPRSLI